MRVCAPNARMLFKPRRNETASGFCFYALLCIRVNRGFFLARPFLPFCVLVLPVRPADGF